MCRFAVGYHYICPTPISGAQKGGCGKLFFRTLYELSERRAIFEVIDSGNDEEARRYLKSKTRRTDYHGPGWENVRELDLEEICTEVACPERTHKPDRWDYWAPEKFRQYCPSCDRPALKGSSRLPANVPKSLEIRHAPNFQAGERLFDDDNDFHLPMDDEVTWKYVQAASDASTDASTVASSAFTNPRPPPIPIPSRRSSRRYSSDPPAPPVLRDRAPRGLDTLQERSDEDDDESSQANTANISELTATTTTESTASESTTRVPSESIPPHRSHRRNEDARDLRRLHSYERRGGRSVPAEAEKMPRRGKALPFCDVREGVEPRRWL